MQFSATYAAGVLKAIAYKNGQVIGTQVLETAGAAAKLALTADRTALLANRNDLSHVIAEVLDAAGDLVPDAVVEVSFAIDGQGEISATGNGNPRNMASFVQPHHYTYQGRALAIVRPFTTPGAITLQASAPGLAPAKLVISVG